MEASFIQAGPLQQTQANPAILPAAIAALIISSAPCAKGLSATSSEAAFSLSPTTLLFGSQLDGTCSTAQTVTQTSNGKRI
jgi:hypothetical protein